MRKATVFFASLLFLLPVTRPASFALALHRPQSPKEIAELTALSQAIIRERNSYGPTRAPLEIQLDLARRKIDNSQAIARIESQLAALDTQHSLVMNDIVRRTANLYRIAPGPTSGRLVTGPFAGSYATWNPRYAPRTIEKRIKHPDGRTIVLSETSRYEGIVWADGSVEFSDDAFVSPGYLGAIILHESVHFEQDTTPGRSDRQSSVHLEIEAHSESSGPAVAQIFGLTRTERDRIQRSFLRQLESFRRNPRPTPFARPFEGKIRAPAAPYATAGPTARSADPPLYPVAAPAPGRASSTITTPSRVRDEGVAQMADSACRGDWSTAAKYLSDYASLGDRELEFLAQRADRGSSCVKELIRRLVTLRRAGQKLDLPRLRAETDAIKTPPPDVDFIERETRKGRPPCVLRGVWFKDCY